MAHFMIKVYDDDEGVSLGYFAMADVPRKGDQIALQGHPAVCRDAFDFFIGVVDHVTHEFRCDAKGGGTAANPYIVDTVVWLREEQQKAMLYCTCEEEHLERFMDEGLFEKDGTCVSCGHMPRKRPTPTEEKLILKWSKPPQKQEEPR